MAAGSPSFVVLAILVAIVVAVGGVGAGLVYELNHPKRPAAPAAVVIGDNVTVNYIGVFGSGPEEGKVFDTSIQAVADDNASYPKSLEYSPRSPSGYTPLPVHVGPPIPYSSYNVSGVTYGTVVTGFWQGLLGLSVNETRWITVPPDLGYGPLVSSCLVTAPLVSTLASVLTLSPSEFRATYPNATAAAGMRFVDPTYGWADTVLSANTTAVVVQFTPTVGEIIAPYGWTEVVTNLTARTVTVASELTPSSVGNVLGDIPGVTVCSTASFLVWSVDYATGTFVENYNREVVGETLVFEVTVDSILPS